MVEKIYIQRFLSDGSLNENEEDITCLPLRSYSDTNIAVTNIEGLAPMPGTINMDDNAGSDGSIYNSARAQSRNIVITMKPFEEDTYDYEGNYITRSMEATRRKIYLIFPLKKKIRLTLETDTRTYYIDGYVETINADYFGDLEGAQVSILCPDPYFKVEWPDDGFIMDKAETYYDIDLSAHSSQYFYGLDHDIPMEILIIINRDIDGSKYGIVLGRGLNSNSMEYMGVSKLNFMAGDNILINTKTRKALWIGMRNAENLQKNALPFISFNTLASINKYEYYIPGNNPPENLIGKHRLLFNTWYTFDKDAPTKFIFYANDDTYVSNTSSVWEIEKYYYKIEEYVEELEETVDVYRLLDAKPDGWDDPESEEYYTNYYINEPFASVVIKPILEYEGV